MGVAIVERRPVPPEWDEWAHWKQGEGRVPFLREPGKAWKMQSLWEDRWDWPTYSIFDKETRLWVPHEYEVDWRSGVFLASLTFIAFLPRHHTPPAVGLVSREGDEYVMFLSDFEEVLKAHNLFQGKILWPRWRFIKRGGRYGIVPDIEEVEHGSDVEGDCVAVAQPL